MCVGKGMFIFQSSWMLAHNSFTYWDPNPSAASLISDCFSHSQPTACFPNSLSWIERFLSHSISMHFPLKCLSAPAHLFWFTQVLEATFQLSTNGIKNQYAIYSVLRRVYGLLCQSKNMFYFEGEHSQWWLEHFSLSNLRERKESLLSVMPCRRIIILSRSYIELDSSLSYFSTQLLPRLKEDNSFCSD